jgi:hypothetical protein
MKGACPRVLMVWEEGRWCQWIIRIVCHHAHEKRQDARESTNRHFPCGNYGKPASSWPLIEIPGRRSSGAPISTGRLRRVRRISPGFLAERCDGALSRHGDRRDHEGHPGPGDPSSGVGATDRATPVKAAPDDPRGEPHPTAKGRTTAESSPCRQASSGTRSRC